MARLSCFKFTDPASGEVHFLLDTAAASLDSEYSSYAICTRQDSPRKLDLKPSNEALSIEAYATLFFCPPLLVISTHRNDVFVVPAYLDSISPKCSSRAWQYMRLEPASEACSNRTVLRHGDTIRIGTISLRVEAEITASDVQVGSSIPTAAEDKLDAAEPQPLAHHRPTSIIEVDRSLRAQDSFTANTQSPKPIPVVAETPASRHKQLDTVAEDAAQDDSSQLPESVQEQLQFAVDSNDDSQSDTPALGGQESQELLGCNTTMRAGMLAKDDEDDESLRQQSKECSTESEDPFATAQSENLDASLEDQEPDVAPPVEGEENAGVLTAGVADDTESENEETLQPQPEPHSAADTTTKDSTPPPVKKGKKRKSDSNDGVSTAKKRKSSSSGEEVEPVQDESIVVLQQNNSSASSQAMNERHKSETPLASSAKSAISVGSASGKNKAQRMIFSNSAIPQRSSIMKFLTKQGAKQVDNATPKGFDVLVVGTGELKRTSKLLTALALGKPVVTDDWVFQSSKEGALLDVTGFSPKDAAMENGWGFNLEETAGHDRRSLFKGKSIFVTPALKREYGRGFEDIVSLARLVGAKTVVSKPARDAIQADAGTAAETIIIGLEKEDIDAQSLIEHGKVCYTKDLISISILRGTLDLDDAKLKIVAHGLKAKVKTTKKVR